MRNNSEYAAFAATRPVLGVYDDHDFGENDGDRQYAHKAVALTQLLDFLEEPADSPRRTRGAAYAVHRFHSADKRHSLRVILLGCFCVFVVWNST